MPIAYKLASVFDRYAKVVYDPSYDVPLPPAEPLRFGLGHGLSAYPFAPGMAAAEEMWEDYRKLLRNEPDSENF